ncbi:MAG: DHA2 family efflux MFS transporter permease subunit [Oxalobacter sp.]|nr:MAG: DHA2 family efflux MFS transporter permease subunit [Oxalobacter sp.]
MFFQRTASLDELTSRFGGRYKWMVLFTLAFGSVASVLSTTSFNVAIPTLMREFALGQDKIQWAITGFMAAMTISMLPTPWLLDRFGFRRCFIGTIMLLAAASIAGSLTTQFSFLVVTRILQGTAAGLLQPFGTLAVMRLFPAEIQGRALGILSFSVVLAPAVAPTLGGLLLDHFGWEAIFLINLPMCLVAGVAAFYLLPQAEAMKPSPFDWAGVALLGIATLSSVESVASLHDSGLWSWRTGIFITISLSAFLLFALHARRSAHPIVKLELFADRAFAMGTLVSLAYGFGIYASTYLIPVFLQNVLGFSATAAGLTLLPAGLTLAAMLPITGHMADRTPPRLIAMCGLSLFCLSFMLFAMMGMRISYAELIGFTVLGRIGLAMILPSLTLAALRGMEHHQLPQSSMAISYVRQLGGVFGVAISAVFLEWRTLENGSTLSGISSAYSETFMLLAAAFGFALIAAGQMKRKPAH